VDGIDLKYSVYYNCNESYVVIADQIGNCKKTGQWNGTEPSCMGKNSGQI